MYKKFFGVLQKVGKALMLPVALLPAAGILLAFGHVLQNPQLTDRVAFLRLDSIVLISQIMEQSGNVIFSNLPLLFAVGVAVGLVGGDGVAGLAAIIGYLIMNVTIGTTLGITAEMTLEDPGYVTVLGIPTLQTGVFGGVIVGIVAALLYKKYFTIQLPPYLGFFAGKRFVPIITAVVAVLLGIVMTLVWEPVQVGLNVFSYRIIETNLTLAAFIFGVIERALIPFGLHHIFYSPFWFEFGQYVDQSGNIIRGDQQIFFAQLRDGVEFTAGTFMTGKFPFMMFGLPAAALAITRCARPEKRKYVAGIMGSAALTSFLTGITEPVEFAFLFVAPLLFAIHTIFAGLSFMVMHILGVKIGMTFSGGIIDFLLFGVLPNRTDWFLVIPVGIAFSVIYYCGFRYVIKKFDLMTPGRDTKSEGVQFVRSSKDEFPYKVLEAFGGKENIVDLDACITRLRVTVKEIKVVDKERLKHLGASGFMEIGNNIQAIFGPMSDILKTQIHDIVIGKIPLLAEKREKSNRQSSLVSERFDFPMKGKVIPLEEVPDPIFAQKMMGDGFAIKPTSGEVFSPVGGTIVTVFPTKHALCIESDGGKELIIHIGIETVNLEGNGFEVFVEEGSAVKKGELIMNVDLDYIEKHSTSTITPIIFTNIDDNERMSIDERKREIVFHSLH